MPPLPGNPGNPDLNSGRLVFAAIYNEFGTFPRKVTSNFQQNLEDATRQPKASPRGPKDGQREPKGTPKGAKGSPKGSQREPKDIQREPKGFKVGQKETKGTPTTPKGSQRDKMYIYKLPINRPNGRYVMYSLDISSLRAHLFRFTLGR